MTSTCIRIKLRQEIGSDYPDITGKKTRAQMTLLLSFVSDFSVQCLEGVSVCLHGLGPLNWVGQKMILRTVQHNITNILLFSGREIIRQVKIF